MWNTFTLLDLPSQALAVQRLLRGLPAREKLAWLSTHGRLALVPTAILDAQQVYRFETEVSPPCCFFIDGDVFVFFGDHTTYTVKEGSRD